MVDLRLLAVLAAVSTLPPTLRLLDDHRSNWIEPHLQLPVLRIVLMVPLYALDAAVGLYLPTWKWLDTARECYEAFVIYNFVLYLIRYLGGPADISRLLRARPPVRHLFPLGYCLPQWRMGAPYLAICRRGALQYVVVRLVASALACASQLCSSTGLLPRHEYEEGDLLTLYPYLAAVNTVSQSWAIYALVMFFRAVRAQLSPIRPLLKFGCVKAIVFLTFWQSCAIELAAHLGRVPQVGGDAVPQREAANVLRNVLLCFEMALASLILPYAFPTSEYSQLPRATKEAHAPYSLWPWSSGDSAAREMPDEEPADAAAAAAAAPSLTATLYGALVPDDVMSDMASASWRLFRPDRLGIMGSHGGLAPSSSNPSRSPSMAELSVPLAADPRREPSGEATQGDGGPVTWLGRLGAKWLSGSETRRPPGTTRASSRA